MQIFDWMCLFDLEAQSKLWIRFWTFPELVKIHIEEVKKLMPNIKRANHENIVRFLGVSYDDFRKEVWVIPKKRPTIILFHGFLFKISRVYLLK